MPKKNEFILPASIGSIFLKQQIAACLSAIDARIAAATEQLAALKTHKKGLMQQLFPRVGA